MPTDHASSNGANPKPLQPKRGKKKPKTNGTEPQAEAPVIIPEPQAEAPVIIPEPQAEAPANGTEPQAEAPANGTEPQADQPVATLSSRQEYRPASKANRPCPRCGGNDRFFWGSLRQLWICRQCNHTEPDADSDGIYAEAAKRELRGTLTDNQREFVYRAYTALAIEAMKYLWSDRTDAKEALKYLRGRGLTDATIKRFGLGYCPDNDDFRRKVIITRSGFEDFSSEVGDGLVLGGLAYERSDGKGCHKGEVTGYSLGIQTKHSISIPYPKKEADANGKPIIVYLRFRMFEGESKYLSPAGPAFAGGDPCLFNCLTINDSNKRIILTEGEFKAMLAEQEGFPAVAIPGISLLIPSSAPNRFSQLEQLANKEVVLCFDSEERKKPFELSVGERWTITYAQRITGFTTKKELDKIKKEYKPRKLLLDSDGKVKDCDENKEINEQRIEYDSSKAVLEKELFRLEGLNIRLFIQQLPRSPLQPKVDLDSFLLEHGAKALSFIAVEEAEKWLPKHTTTRFWYKDGGIMGFVVTKGRSKAREIANYAVRGLYNEEHFDGKDSVMFHHFVLQRANRTLTSVRIANEAWRNDAKALDALRAAEGTLEANDKGAASLLESIKTLSLWGGDLAVERVYTATGWEQIMGRWFYLTPDGAISARGFKPSPFAELDKELPNMWYGSDTPGDPRLGAKTLLDHLRDPEPAVRQLGFITLAHYFLPPIHRFLKQTGRPLLFFMGKSASFKTSYATTLLGFYGKDFVEVGDTGKQSLSFEMSLPAIELSLYSMRDYMCILDNYLPSTQRKRNSFDVENFIHLYSQGAGRTVSQNYGTSLRKTHGSRALIIITGETMPDTPGEVGRLIPLVFPSLAQDVADAKGKLKVLQIAGHEGHFSALFREFITWLAVQLDQRQTNNPFKAGFEQTSDDFVSWLQGIMEADDLLDAGHNRVSKALSQNKCGFWVFLEFMTAAKYITQDERTEFEAAYLAARKDLACQLRPQNTQKTTTASFIEVIQDVLGQGTYCLEPIYCQNCSDDEEEKMLERNGVDFVCSSCNHRVEARFVLGWQKGRTVALYYQAAYDLAKSRIGGTNQTSLLQLLYSAGLVAERGVETITKPVRNPFTKGHKPRMLVLKKDVIFPPPSLQLCKEAIALVPSFIAVTNDLAEDACKNSEPDFIDELRTAYFNHCVEETASFLIQQHEETESDVDLLQYCELYAASSVKSLVKTD